MYILFCYGSVCSPSDWRILLYVLVLSWLSRSVDIDAAVSIWICRTAKRDKTMPNIKIQKKWKLEWTLFSSRSRGSQEMSSIVISVNSGCSFWTMNYFSFSCLYLPLATMLKRERQAFKRSDKPAIFILSSVLKGASEPSPAKIIAWNKVKRLLRYVL